MTLGLRCSEGGHVLPGLGPVHCSRTTRVSVNFGGPHAPYAPYAPYAPCAMSATHTAQQIKRPFPSTPPYAVCQYRNTWQYAQ
eukprot:3387104-Rhodomonas_salina.1